MIKQSIN